MLVVEDRSTSMEDDMSAMGESTAAAAISGGLILII